MTDEKLIRRFIDLLQESQDERSQNPTVSSYIRILCKKLRSYCEMGTFPIAILTVAVHILYCFDLRSEVGLERVFEYLRSTDSNIEADSDNKAIILKVLTELQRCVLIPGTSLKEPQITDAAWTIEQFRERFKGSPIQKGGHFIIAAIYSFLEPSTSIQIPASRVMFRQLFRGVSWKYAELSTNKAILRCLEPKEFRLFNNKSRPKSPRSIDLKNLGPINVELIVLNVRGTTPNGTPVHAECNVPSWKKGAAIMARMNDISVICKSLDKLIIEAK